MALESLPSLKIIGDLILILSGQLDKLRGTPKQRFGKKVISLLNLCNEAQESIGEVIQHLTLAEKAVLTSKKKKHLEDMTKVSIKFSMISRRFLSWLNENDDFYSVIDLLYPKPASGIRNLVYYDELYSNPIDYLNVKIDNELSNKFYELVVKMDKKVIQNTRNDFEDIDNQLEKLRDSLREIARKNLTIDDLF